MKQNTSSYIKFILTVYFSVTSALLSSANNNYQNNNNGNNYLFSSNTTIELDLITNMKKLRKDHEDSKYQKALLIYKTEDDTVTINTEIRTRGSFRKQRSICNFPPIQMRFDSVSVTGTIFQGQTRLKMVTHCRTNRKPYLQNMFQEYLIYRTLNIITDSSYRVRLAKIRYIDKKQRTDTIISYAFFKERSRDLAVRLGGKTLKAKRVHPTRTQHPHMNQISLFQYMIGNTDWSVRYLHNIKIIATETKKLPLAIPYDFDWSGAVFAPYSEPNEVFDIKSVRERVYRGYVVQDKILYRNIRIFNRKKDMIYNLYKNFDLLTESERKQTLKYYDQFYRIINRPASLKHNIIKEARKYNDNSAIIVGLDHEL